MRIVFYKAFLLIILFASGCAHYPINQPLKGYDPEKGYRLKNISASEDSKSLSLILTFSGGGMRAAAFSYGLLEELNRTKISLKEHSRSLLDEVDIISSVSGGSFTAAYYGLFGKDIFNGFEDRFLKKNIQRSIIIRLLLPQNWFRLASPAFNRSDLAAEYYDKYLFKAGTFSDIAAREGPFVFINATDMTMGTWFSFSQNQFDLICSDLSSFPVSRAVSASSAVPVVLSPITLRNYSGGCGYNMPEWMVEALEKRETASRRFHQAVNIISYLDAKKRPYIHLLDGGLSDNLGLRVDMDRVILVGSAWRALEEIGVRTSEVVFIVVNAETESDISWDQQENVPTISQALKSATSVLMNRYNFETIELLKENMQKWTKEINERRCKEPAAESGTEPCREISFYIIEVTFDALKDESERIYLKGLPTSLKLPSEAVDRLRKAAKEILTSSEEFQRLLRDLENKSFKK